MNSVADATIKFAAVTDRGLSNKRPVNEDSYVADEPHKLFVVADGVGGAQAGDIASQTAVEVLADAFGHRREGDDVEDLMEIAIQRANAAIHQMSREHAKLSMMATTLVALHLDGLRATIGHVGDSRLYRLTPGGQLLRETEDHSMVEEEVRAGRMTPEQAAHHPSRNVISRALGAEESVEVDLKTIEIEPGTSFLLCSDGITRHLEDAELQELLATGEDEQEICDELKRICYERGAEDNLTALLVTVGERTRTAITVPFASSPVEIDDDEDRTVTTARPAALSTTSLPGETSKRPFSKVVVTPPEARPRGDGGGGLKTLAALFVIAALTAAAFYGGLLYGRREASQQQQGAETSNPAATATPVETSEPRYERLRREVDQAPLAAAEKMARDANGAPLGSGDPEFLYLYGRALLLSGRYREAGEAFRLTISRLEEQPAGGHRHPLRIETRLSAAAAALKSESREATQAAARELDEVIEKGAL